MFAAAGPIAMFFVVGMYILLIYMFVVMVKSIKRIAISQEEMVSVNKTIAEQLSKIAVEIKNTKNF